MIAGKAIPAALPPAERLARLALARSEGVGPVAFRRLLARFGSGAAALAALPAAAQGRAAAPPAAALAAAEAEIARVLALGGRHLFLGEADYPPLLAETEDAPPVLAALGDPALAHRPAVAIVGARNASALGLRMARQLAEALAAEGVVVVSGLARGVDSAAHRAALGAPGGRTIACVAGGPDIAYPPENAGLQEEIAARGLLLSEQPPGTEPQARHFPRRNRLIAGIAAGVVVVEAAPGSGSLITARLAAEAGREVMAVPGHPLDPRATGCNRLLREGATLVETAADILEALAPFRGIRPGATPAAPGPLDAGARPRGAGAPPGPPDAPHAARPGPSGGEGQAPSDALATRLLGLLSAAPVGVDELVRASGAGAGDVQAALVDLELKGLLARHAGGRVSLA